MWGTLWKGVAWSRQETWGFFDEERGGGLWASWAPRDGEHACKSGELEEEENESEQAPRGCWEVVLSCFCQGDYSTFAGRVYCQGKWGIDKGSQRPCHLTIDTPSPDEQRFWGMVQEVMSPSQRQNNALCQEKWVCRQGACNISFRPPSNFSSHPTTTHPEVAARLGSLTRMLFSEPARLLQQGQTGMWECCVAATSSDTSSYPLPLPITSHRLLHHLEYPSTHYLKQQKALAGDAVRGLLPQPSPLPKDASKQQETF